MMNVVVAHHVSHRRRRALGFYVDFSSPWARQICAPPLSGQCRLEIGGKVRQRSISDAGTTDSATQCSVLLLER